MPLKIKLIAFAVVVLALNVCNLPGTDEIDAISTAALQTIQAQGNSGDAAPTATGDAGQPADPSSTSPPSNTSPPPTTTNTPTPESACDLAGFITDVTIPDGTKMSPGNNFTKTWRLKNNGSCAWTSGYEIIFFGGDQMNGPGSQQLTNAIINPGQTIDISVNLTAPGSAGTYRGDWKLKNPSGQIFSLNGGIPFYVEIEVVEPTTTPANTLTPTPALVVNFTAGYAGGWFCDTQSKRSFKITNTGDLTIESMQITLEGPINTYLNGFSNNAPFRPVPPEPSPQCKQAGVDSLAVDNIAWVSVHTTSPPPGGTSSRAIIKMCSEENLGGTCKEFIVNFTW